MITSSGNPNAYLSEIMENSYPSSNWSELFAGVLYYQAGYLFRPKSLWSSRHGDRSNAIRLASFRRRLKGRFSFEIRGNSPFGDFAVAVAPSSFQIGIPSLMGTVQSREAQLAHIMCDPRSSQLLSLRVADGSFRLTVAKILPSEDESDVTIEECKLGELVKIVRRDYDFREEIASRLGFGLCRRGFFKDEAAFVYQSQPLAICLIATLCLYFDCLEGLMNTFYGSG